MFVMSNFPDLLLEEQIVRVEILKLNFVTSR